MNTSGINGSGIANYKLWSRSKHGNMRAIKAQRRRNARVIRRKQAEQN